MTLYDPARQIGWENEYHMWYRSFSNWVHSDPSQMNHPGYDGSVALLFCYHYYAGMLLRIADVGKIVLTQDQYEGLTKLADEFA